MPVFRRVRVFEPSPSGAAMISTGPAYVGPGDVVAGADGWWGLRAYSAATEGNKAVNLRRSSDNATSDFNTLANGNLDVASIAAFMGAGNVFIATLYDQTGNGNDLSQATTANQPQLVLGSLGSLPTMQTSGSQTLGRLSTPATAQPLTIAAVATRSFTGIAGLFGGLAGPDPVVYFESSANLVQLYAGGTAFDAACSDGAWHSIQGVFNGASSIESINGTNTTGTTGTGALLNGPGDTLTFFGDGIGNNVTGNATEVGVWPIGFTTGQLSSMSANQRAYWGI